MDLNSVFISAFLDELEKIASQPEPPTMQRTTGTGQRFVGGLKRVGRFLGGAGQALRERIQRRRQQPSQPAQQAQPQQEASREPGPEETKAAE